MSPAPSDAVSQTAITYSRGFGKLDNTPEQITVATFPDFCDAVAADRATGKGQQWIASGFAIAPDDAQHRGADAKARAIGKHHRCSSCAHPRRFLGLDVDGGLTAESLAALVAHLHRYSGLVYTTASHTPTAPRCRVLLELDVAAPRAELIAATKAVRARIDAAMIADGFSGIEWDASCDKPEQPLYAPLTGSDVYNLDGQSLRLTDLLKSAQASTATPARGLGSLLAAAQAARPAAFTFSPNTDPTNIVVDAGRHDDLLDITGKLARNIHFDGWARGSVLELLHAERARGHWHGRHLSDAEIANALDGALNNLRSGVWPQPNAAPNESAASTAELAQTPRLIEVDLSDLGSAALSPTRFVFDPIIPRGVVTMLGGHGGSGKSSLALILAAHAACGTPWAGFECGVPA